MGAQHTALGAASAEGEGGAGDVVTPYRLRPVCEEVQDPAAQGRVQSQCVSVWIRVCRMIVLKAEAKSRKSS